MPGNHQVYVFRQDGAGAEHIAGVINCPPETMSNSQGLPTGELHGMVLQCFLGCQAPLVLVGMLREGPPRRDLGRPPKAEQFATSHVVRPRSEEHTSELQYR